MNFTYTIDYIILGMRKWGIRTNEEIPAKKSKKSDIISIFAENVDDEVNESEMKEVLRYYNYPLTQEDLKEEPITFWLFDFWLNICKYISQMAQFIHWVSATNLSSERNFNYSGLTITDRKSRLDWIPKKLTKCYLSDLILIYCEFHVLKV